MAFGLPRVPLRFLAEGDRFHYLDRLEQYLRNRQDDAKRYTWEGDLREFGGVTLYSPLPAGFDVPIADRKPSTRYNLARVIVGNLTQMALGGTSFPEILVEKDETAQQALRRWAKIMRLRTRMAEARNLGGAMGSACLSLGISRGRFRLDVHNPKHITVLDWADREEFVPSRVLKAYAFEQEVPDSDSERMVKRTVWYVRYWDSQIEATWQELPDEVAKLGAWHEVAPTFVARHGFGFTPFYWTQNLPDSQEMDGEGDFEGSEDKIDEINVLLSATTRGARKNVDPTLVIRDTDNDDGPVSKGSGAVIYSPGGAEYLELQGTAIVASRELVKELRDAVLEEAQVVVPRVEDISGGPVSAAAMRIRYRPMISRCDVLRDQYGEVLERILTDVLRIAKSMRARPPYEVARPDGSRELVRDEIVPNLDPGNEELVTLRWPEYFAPTALDIKDTTTTAQGAAGGKPVISHRTAVDYVSRMFGVEDPEAELARIEEDADAEADRMGEQLEREAEVFASKRPVGGTPPEDGAAE